MKESVRKAIKQRLRRGDTLYGTFIALNSPDAVEVLGISGFDFVVIDTEHGPMSVESTTNLIRAAEVREMAAFTRVTSASTSTILRSLDVGPAGVMVPQVSNCKAAEKIVAASHYHPVGTRGLAMPRSSLYGACDVNSYLERTREDLVIIVQCESKESLERVAAIAAVPYVDVVFIGPYDLSQSLGVPGEIDHPLVKEAEESVLEACSAAGKAAGILAGNGEAAKKKAEQGFRFIGIGLDILLLSAAAKRELQAAKE